MNRVVLMTRGSLIELAYTKTLEFPATRDTKSKAMTVISTDIETAALGIEDAHEIWASLVQTGLAIWLLERQVLWACIAPCLITLGKRLQRSGTHYSI